MKMRGSILKLPRKGYRSINGIVTAVRRTEIVSGGFADGAGSFPLAGNIPYAEERP